MARNGHFLHAPDTYMSKIAVGPAAQGVIDLSRSPTDNLNAIADAKGVYVEDLKRMLRADATYLRVGIYRARRQLAGAGVPSAEQIVERRVSTGQIRLGTERVSVERL